MAMFAGSVLLCASFTVRLFVLPALSPLQGLHANALVVLGGPGPRLELALQLERDRAAPVMLVSVASVLYNCPDFDLPGVRVECFRPDPFSTQGEARYVGQQGRIHGWRSIIVVSSVPQATRARLRVKRCFGGDVLVVGARPSPASWAYEVVYEWGALAKALLWQTAC